MNGARVRWRSRFAAILIVTGVAIGIHGYESPLAIIIGIIIALVGVAFM